MERKFKESCKKFLKDCKKLTEFLHPRVGGWSIADYKANLSPANLRCYWNMAELGNLFYHLSNNKNAASFCYDLCGVKFPLKFMYFLFIYYFVWKEEGYRDLLKQTGLERATYQ